MKINQSIIERQAEWLTDESQAAAVPEALPVQPIEGDADTSNSCINSYIPPTSICFKKVRSQDLRG